MTNKFKTGQEIYSVDGQVAHYVGPAAMGGHVVQPCYEYDDHEPHFGDPEYWREVFDQPPARRLAQEAARYDAMIAEKRAALRDIEEKTRTAEREQQDLLKRIKSRPDLHDLDLWLQGKVTHIVSLDYYSIKIGTVEEVLRETGREKQLRLLSLLADPSANRYWVGYSAYSDGSSNQTRCLLATSLEHAQERAAEYVAQEIRRNSTTDHSSLVISAHAQGVAVPTDLLAKAQAKAAAAKAERIQRAREQLARLQAELAAQVQQQGEA
ncbi:hypothetical protein [Bordetella hinzii]|uniref:Uncharacterized protein n=1 Tax=Bordetella hinzii OH87 BAL007II TaxID=1331262 RepID=A0ABR4R580_9BORD|nr:hypothetical protein [Bordetella hinzii]KCB26124.1 hypothetical protein L544_3262 [Bordetella hinzii OH87 BAL007II]